MLMRITMWPPVYGAYTNLWAGLSSEVTIKDGGSYAIPWGKWHIQPKKEFLNALKSEEEGGTGEALLFWNWCDEQTRQYE